MMRKRRETVERIEEAEEETGSWTGVGVAESNTLPGRADQLGQMDSMLALAVE